MSYNGIVLADLHIGAMPVEKLYNEIDNVLFSYIRSLKKLDFIIICGDYFDHKLFLNDKESSYAYSIMRELLTICKPFNTKIRFVYGTASHECNQYGILSQLSQYADIKVIYTVSEEELLPGMDVLYIPEEHVFDKNEYYKSHFDKQFTYVFGHGIIKEVMSYVSTLNETKVSKRKKVPVFTTSELRNIAKETYFGHYHMHTDNSERVSYIGSFSRWKFGEEEPKGFYHIKYHDNKPLESEFIENELADIYKTIYFGYDSPVFKSRESLEKKLDQVDRMIKSEAMDHVRFEFSIPESIENPEFIINYLNERYKYNDKVKVEVVHGYIEAKKKKQKETIEKENEKYSIIFDKSVKMEDKVSYFISVEFDKELKPDDISNYLYQSLNEIIK